jgi:polyhydroxyalkanoate synthesis repressor PhaR
MLCSLDRLECTCNLAVRGSEKSRDLLGQRLVGGEPGELALPKVEIAPGKPISVTGSIACVVVVRGHAPTIAHHGTNAPFACANGSLSHCGIGAKVAAFRVNGCSLASGRERSVMADQAATEGGPKPAPVVIKKYANRRLYNTATSAYVTLDHLATMVKEKTDFVVYDAKTGDDITRSVLTQIIFEEESKGGQTLLPIPFLRQLISFYGDSLQGVVPQYLEMSMAQFARNQEQMRKYLQNAFGFNPFQQFEAMGKQNMEMFERAMRMFNPFQRPGGPGMPPAAANGQEPPAKPETPGGNAPPSEGAIDDLKRKLDELQNQLAELSKKS